MKDDVEFFRGHRVYKDIDGVFYYCSDDEPVETNWEERGCGHCGKMDTPEGYDGCFGYIPGALNACCGHGKPDEAYIQFGEGESNTIRGGAAVLHGCASADVREDTSTPQDELDGSISLSIEEVVAKAIDNIGLMSQEDSEEFFEEMRAKAESNCQRFSPSDLRGLAEYINSY